MAVETPQFAVTEGDPQDAPWTWFHDDLHFPEASTPMTCAVLSDLFTAALTAACEELYRAGIDLGGTVTGEHGIGVARLKFLELQRGPDAVRVMHQIKAALDPLNILNPGRAV